MVNKDEYINVKRRDLERNLSFNLQVEGTCDCFARGLAYLDNLGIYRRIASVTELIADWPSAGR